MPSLLTPFHSPLQPYFLALGPDEGYLTWYAVDTYVGGSEAELAELRDKGWVPLGKDKPEMLLRLSSQLFPVLELAERDTATLRFWGRTADIQYAEHYPVLLVYRVPTQNGAPIHTPETFVVGTNALIAEPEGEVFHYHIDQLGEAGTVLLEDITRGTSSLPLQATKLNSQSIDFGSLNQQANLKRNLWTRAQKAAQQLALLYWQYHQEQPKQKRPVPRALPEIPYAFQKGIARVMAPLAVQGVLGAYSNAQSGAKGWGSETQMPQYTYTKAKESARVELRPIASSQLAPADITRSLWQQVRKLNDLDGDVFLAMLAQWTATQDSEGYSWVTAEHILAYRGIQPRTHQNKDGTLRRGDHRQEALIEIAESVARIRDTHVTVQQWQKQASPIKKRGRPKKYLYQQESYIISVAEFIQQHELAALTDSVAQGLAVAWKYRPGSCLESFLEGRQIVWLLQQALNYDPYHEMWEKRLARYLTFQTRLNQELGGTIITRTVGEVFDELSLPMSHTHPEKTKKRFEKALDRLQQDQQITEWRYQEDIAQRPSHKWIDIWLSYHIQIITKTLQSEMTNSQELEGPKER